MSASPAAPADRAAATAPVSAGRRVFERWIFWPCAVLLLAAAAELGYRALRIVRGRPYADGRAAERVAQIAAENAAVDFGRAARKGAATAPAPGSPNELLPHPYLAFVTRGTLRTLERAVAAMRERERDTVDVVLVGGVGAQMFAGTAREALLDAVAKVPEWRGRDVELWSFAENFCKQPQQLELLLYLTALGADPDLVIDVSGRNEILLGVANAISDSHPIYPVRAKWETLVHGGATDRESLDLLIRAWENQREIARLAARLGTGAVHCAIWADGVLERLERLVLDRELALTTYRRRSEAAQREIVLRGPTPPVDPQQTRIACVSVWYQSTRDLAALCAARGIRFVAVLEPFGDNALLDDPPKPGRARTLESSVDAGRIALEQSARALEKLGVLWIDAALVAEQHRDPRATALGLVGEIAAKLGAPR